jgi:hypothetical protein
MNDNFPLKNSCKIPNMKLNSTSQFAAVCVVNSALYNWGEVEVQLQGLLASALNGDEVMKHTDH